MFFSVDTNTQIIFGWSAKCGCSHIKNIYWFLQTGDVENIIHTPNDANQLPVDIQNYTTIIFARNPYKRIISGFLDKYHRYGEYRHLWKDSLLSFSTFVDKVIQSDWKTIDRHHFTPQTTDTFDTKILQSKHIKFYDIGNIDYKYIEQLYNKKIPACVLNKKQGHERDLRVNLIDCYDKNVYDLHIDDYIDYSVDINYFYNDEIREKVYTFYMNDFLFFKENGIDYINTTF